MKCSRFIMLDFLDFGALRGQHPTFIQSVDKFVVLFCFASNDKVWITSPFWGPVLIWNLLSGDPFCLWGKLPCSFPSQPAVVTSSFSFTDICNRQCRQKKIWRNRSGKSFFFLLKLFPNKWVFINLSCKCVRVKGISLFNLYGSNKISRQKYQFSKKKKSVWSPLNILWLGLVQ